MQDKLYNMLVEKDDITWKTIILDLVKEEKMDPWDIDVSLLAQKYLEAIRELEEHNFFISGKVLLASALLINIKSNKLLTEHIANFDSLLYPPENIEDLEELQHGLQEFNAPRLLVKTPQARKRKVNLNDLMTALHKALEVERKRRIRRSYAVPIREVNIPKKRYDIGNLIKGLYSRILTFLKKKELVTFSELVNSNKKEDKIYTFIPLLHLAHDGKVNIHQEKAFGEINIKKYKDEN